ncbi:MAG TPA: hypothetical protein VMO78_18125 [Rhizomicrobium sp.]|nr:hypothetical protein [Rhizomicrobium sp.]
MAIDISEPILTHLSYFSVGSTKRVEGAGSAIIGSGTLVSIGGRRGILTCGHVAEIYKKLADIGMVRFSKVGNQNRIVKLDEAQTIILVSSPEWSETDLDLAFTMLPTAITESIAAQAIFVNMEMNKAKMQSGEPDGAHSTDAMLGLIAEFSGKPFIEGQEYISPMRGVLHTGNAVTQGNGLLTIKPKAYNMDKLPHSFGGMSGAGTWRLHFAESEAGPTILRYTLIGVASWEEQGNQGGRMSGLGPD